LPYASAAMLIVSVPFVYATKHILIVFGRIINALIHQNMLIDPGTNLRLQIHGAIPSEVHWPSFYFSILASFILLYFIAFLSTVSHQSNCFIDRPSDESTKFFRVSSICAIVIFSAIACIGRTALESAGAESWNMTAGGVFKNVLPFSVGPAATMLHVVGLVLGARLTGLWIHAHDMSSKAREQKYNIPTCPHCGYDVDNIDPRQCPECGLVDLDTKLGTLYLLYRGKSRRRFRLLRSTILIIILLLAPIWWMLVLNFSPVFTRPFLLIIEWVAFVPWWLLQWLL